MNDPSPTSPYDPGYRPRCQVCERELQPCPVFDHDYPQKVRYSGFAPCPLHPHAGVIYRHIPR